MAKNKEYWNKRFEALENAQMNKGAKYFAELEKQYRKASSAVQRDIEKWYARFANNNEITLQGARKLLNTDELEEFRWSVMEYVKKGETLKYSDQWAKQLENASAKWHISRLEALKLQMQNHVEVLFGNEHDDVAKLMEHIYTDGYYHTAYEIQKGFNVGYSLMQLDKNKIEKVISKPWAADGSNFSSRIWKQKNQLVSDLHNNLTQVIIRGQNPKVVTDTIAKRFDVSKMQAGRLVMTESAFFASASNRDCYKDLNVEQYEVLATLDTKTSEICRDLDGKTFKMSEYEVGVTAPPFHCWCRTTTVPYFDDEFELGSERAARDEDGKTYYVPSDMKYDDWYDKYVKGEANELNAYEADILNGIKEIVDKFTSHKPISIFDLDGKYSNSIIKTINNSPEGIKQFLYGHRNEINIINERALSRNKFCFEGIEINLKKDFNEQRGRWTGLFHEIGHNVDRITGKPSSKYGFGQCLKTEFDELVKNYQKYYNVKEHDAFEMISENIRDAKYHSISDLFGALSDNKCVGIYCHRIEYWNQKEMISAEAFAHFFEATCRNDAEKLKAIKQVFPKSFNLFERMLGDIL